MEEMKFRVESRTRGTRNHCPAQRMKQGKTPDYSGGQTARGRICLARDRRAEISELVVMTKGQNGLVRCILHAQNEIASSFSSQSLTGCGRFGASPLPGPCTVNTGGPRKMEQPRKEHDRRPGRSWCWLPGSRVIDDMRAVVVVDGCREFPTPPDGLGMKHWPAAFHILRTPICSRKN